MNDIQDRTVYKVENPIYEDVGIIANKYEINTLST